MKEIRVLHIISSRGVYGAEKVLLDWMEHTPGIKPSLIVFIPVGTTTSPLAEQAEQIGADVLPLPLGPLSFFETYRRISKFLKHVKPDVIHSHGYKGLFYGRLITGRKRGFIHTNHGFIDNSRKGRLYTGIEIQIARWTPPDAIIVVSESVKRRYLNAAVAENRIHVMQNAIPVPSENAMNLLNLPGDLEGIAAGRKAILYAGRLSREKGVDVLLNAVPRILDHHSDAIIVLIAGDGPEADNLLTQAGTLGIQERVNFLGFRGDVRNIMANCELVVMPSRTEGIPITLLEAMSLKKAVVASRVGGIPEVLTDENDGLLVDSETPEMLADAVCRILNDRNLAERLGRSAFMTVKERFNLSDRVKVLRRFYERSCESS